MNTHRVKSGKTGRSGWCFRFTDPVTGRRTHKTFWFGERREAETAFRLFLEGRDSKRLNLPDHSGWCMSYQDLVKRFLVEAPISTERRRARLQLVLGRNECGLQVGSDLAHIGKLSATCRKVQEKKGEHYAVFSLQAALKQLSRWAACVALLPHDPLGGWKRLPSTGLLRLL
mgnify:CR=1 FL=1